MARYKQTVWLTLFRFTLASVRVTAIIIIMPRAQTDAGHYVQ